MELVKIQSILFAFYSCQTMGGIALSPFTDGPVLPQPTYGQCRKLLRFINSKTWFDRHGQFLVLVLTCSWNLVLLKYVKWNIKDLINWNANSLYYIPTYWHFCPQILLEFSDSNLDNSVLKWLNVKYFSAELSNAWQPMTAQSAQRILLLSSIQYKKWFSSN